MTNLDSSSKYSADYYQSRLGSDLMRKQQFRLDASYIKKFVSSGPVCDIGCSTGEFFAEVDLYDDYFGVEVNEYAIEKAKSVGIRFDKNIYNTENYFQVVIFRGVLQHLDEPFATIKAAIRSLKRGGHLYF